MDIEGDGVTRGGSTGSANEDAFLADEGLGLYVVCDGDSARPAGEVAAKAAVEALEEFVERAGDSLGIRGERASRAIVARAMIFALHAVRRMEDRTPDWAGLSTTVTALLVHGTVGIIGHRGDSRAYLIRSGRIRQLTVDLELTEAFEHPETRDAFDVFSFDLHPGDTIVLCTDGAEHVVMNDELVEMAEAATPSALASRIVLAAHALEKGSDATAVVVRTRKGGGSAWLELSRPTRSTEFGHTLAYA